jgi:hypothetical protein
MKTKSFSTAPELYPIRNVIVVDGDTLKGEIVLPLGVTKWQIVRLKGWWAPEPTGASLHQGVAARGCLERFCEGKNLFLLVLGSRFDRYGRLVAALWWGSSVVDPARVLGTYQLTEDAHRRLRDAGAGILTPQSSPSSATPLLRVENAPPLPEAGPPSEGSETGPGSLAFPYGG